jgi:hypothetical protein
MTNKNPFEIRADMLAMAKDYMDQQYHINMDFVRQLYEQNKVTAEEFKAACQPYSIEEMMKKAQELYSFVSKKD